jgi:pimeloyl-ACP methyl ester carboxylesterase
MQTPVIEEIAGLRLEVVRQGKGPRILFLHPHLGLYGAAAFIDALSGHAEVLAPSHPGFGKSELRKGMNTVEDLSYYYLDLLDALDWDEVTLIGASFGGWVAAAMAVKNCSRLSGLVLMDTLGVKLAAGSKGDFVNFFSTPRGKLEEMYYHSASLARRDIPDASDEERAIIARNWEASAMYGWNPYMHDPKLRGRLARIRIPSLVLWGEADAIVPQAYGRAYSEMLPQGRFETIPGAGHFPHIEKPRDTAQHVLKFANEVSAKAEA